MEKYFQNLKEFKENLEKIELTEEVANEILKFYGKESLKEFLKNDDKEMLEGLKEMAEIFK